MAEVLKLMTVRNRRRVLIDGAEFEMLDQDEMSLADAVELEVLAKEVVEAAKGGKKREDMDGLAARIRAAARLVMPGVPAELEAKLHEPQRASVLFSFFKPAAEPVPAVAEHPAGNPSSICSPGL